MIFLPSPVCAAQYAAKYGIALCAILRISGWGHRSAPISYAQKMAAMRGEAYLFHQVLCVILDAREPADLAQIDADETHDCFAMTE